MYVARARVVRYSKTNNRPIKVVRARARSNADTIADVLIIIIIIRARDNIIIIVVVTTVIVPSDVMLL